MVLVEEDEPENPPEIPEPYPEPLIDEEDVVVSTVVEDASRLPVALPVVVVPTSTSIWASARTCCMAC